MAEAQGQLSTAVAPGHEVVVEDRLVGGEECFVAVCSCGHESAPALIRQQVETTAGWHAREAA